MIALASKFFKKISLISPTESSKDVVVIDLVRFLLYDNLMNHEILDSRRAEAPTTFWNDYSVELSDIEAVEKSPLKRELETLREANLDVVVMNDSEVIAGEYSNQYDVFAIKKLKGTERLLDIDSEGQDPLKIFIILNHDSKKDVYLMLDESHSNIDSSEIDPCIWDALEAIQVGLFEEKRGEELRKLLSERQTA